MRVNKFVIALFLLIVFSSLLFLLRNYFQRKNPPLNLGYLMGAQSMPMLVARENKYFQDVGLDVNTVDLTRNWGQQIGLLASDVLDCSNSTKFYTVGAVAKGIPIKIITSLATREGNPVAIPIAKKDSGIKSFKDVAGKTFGFKRGGTTEYLVIKFLGKNGLGEEDVYIEELGDSDAIAAFRSGKIDVYVADILSLEEIKKDVGVNVLGDSSEIMPNSFSDTIVCREDYIKSHPEEVKKLISAIYRASKLINENPDETKTILEKLDFSPTWQKIEFPEYALDNRYSGDGIDAISDWLFSIKATDKKVKTDNVIFNL